MSTGMVLETVRFLRTQFGFANPELAELLVRFLPRRNVAVAKADKNGLIGALYWTRGVSGRRISDAIVTAAAHSAGVEAIATLDEKVASPTRFRRGDLWYQLETALREVCVTIPEATAPEFEGKVNELMLVSLSLTGRPKRRRPGATARQAKGAWAK